MKKTIYISGPITDNETGQPRDGWKREFLEAEWMLGRMGFGVINPVDIAEETDDEWRQMWQTPAGIGKLKCQKSNTMLKQGPTRATYVNACLQTMNTEALAGRLHGMWLLGSSADPYAKQRIYHSHGVQMELHMAMMLGIPMFAKFYDGNEVDIHLLPVKDGLRLCENGKFGHENWSEKF